MSRSRKKLISFKLRESRYGAFCCVCLEQIEPGEHYRDGGYWRSAHELCAQKAELDPDMEHSRKEQDEAAEKLCREYARLVCAEPGDTPPTMTAEELAALRGGK